VNAGIVVVTSGFPRRSETFALNELQALHERGLLAGVFATKEGDGSEPDGAGELPLELLPPGSAAEQSAALLDRVDPRRVAAVHGYFAHLPAEVAESAARRLGVPHGFSAHARDARKISRAELGRRAAAASCVVACNSDVAEELRAAGASPALVPHGVDLARFGGRIARSEGPLEVLAVGRLVPKKGFDVLVEAARAIESPFRLRVTGEGAERPRLEAAIAAHGLGARVCLEGAATQSEVASLMGTADVFVAPSIVDAEGDRDGLPNVVLEAMAAALPVVATPVGAISSAVVHGETGLLVAPGDAQALAAAIDRLARDPELRLRLGAAGRRDVEQRFALAACTDRLARVLERAYA
jgi:glycosyltransferase involved in cell wall biosynthesis